MKSAKYLLPLICILAFAACKKKSSNVTACGIEDPVKNLAWLKDSVNSAKGGNHTGTVNLRRHEGRDYLNIQLDIQSCLFCQIYNCDGTPLTEAWDLPLIQELRVTGTDNSWKTIARF